MPLSGDKELLQEQHSFVPNKVIPYCQGDFYRTLLNLIDKTTF
jgi:hypothetical protein